jgi:hypothetical protein
MKDHEDALSKDLQKLCKEMPIDLFWRFFFEMAKNSVEQ